MTRMILSDASGAQVEVGEVDSVTVLDIDHGKQSNDPVPLTFPMSVEVSLSRLLVNMEAIERALGPRYHLWWHPTWTTPCGPLVRALALWVLP